jgi:cytochrome b subunit of formate dehydrogenase
MLSLSIAIFVGGKKMSKINNRKIAAILIAVILAISGFPMSMAATAEEPDANFTEAVNIILNTGKNCAYFFIGVLVHIYMLTYFSL